MKTPGHVTGLHQDESLSWLQHFDASMPSSYFVHTTDRPNHTQHADICVLDDTGVYCDTLRSLQLVSSVGNLAVSMIYARKLLACILQKKKTFSLQLGVPTLHIPEGFRNRLISPDISEFVWSYSNPEANLGYTHNWEHVKPLYMIMLSFNNLMSSLELNGTGRTRHTLTLNDEMTEL